MVIRFVVVWGWCFAAVAAQPNFLFIMIDDLRPDLGCYGNAVVQTPNIDGLAKRSVTFDRAYVQVAVCNPSRASTLTGLRPDRLGVWNLRIHFREAMPNAVTLPQHLRAHGYHAEGFGKVFHNPWQDPQSWDRPHRWARNNNGYNSAAHDKLIKEAQAAMPKSDWRKTDLRGPATFAPDIEDNDHHEGALTDLAIGRLGKLGQQKKPFFLAVGYTLPHLPWTPPKRYWDLYDRDKLPLAANPLPPEGAPVVALGSNHELGHYCDMIHVPKPLDGRRLSDPEARRMIHGYYASISFIDAQVGRLLAALKKNGLADNTVVVLWSDHGWKLGEHNGWGKMTNYEIDTRIPLVIYHPKLANDGSRRQQLVESLDLFPTFCDVANVPLPVHLDGRSLVPVLRNPQMAFKDAVISQYVRDGMMGYAIRTDAFRYVEWRRLDSGVIEATELYDQRRDPRETRNVASQQPKVVLELKQRLHRLHPPKPITLLPKIHSKSKGALRDISFRNDTKATVRLSLLSDDGRRRQVVDVKGSSQAELGCRTGTVIVAEALDGTFQRIITIGKGAQEVVVP